MKRDLLICGGNAIKADEQNDGTVILTGLAVVFDEPGSKTRDLTGEYFTADATHYGAHAKSGLITVDAPFHHHIPVGDTDEAKALADVILGDVTMEKETKGWLANLVLPMREDYEKAAGLTKNVQEDIAQLAADGKLGWSTGTAGHMYRAADDGMITRWPIVECSPTHMPAEPRTFAGVKSVADLVKRAHGLGKAIEWMDGESVVQLQDRLRRAFKDQFGNGWIADVYSDAVIVEVHDEDYVYRTFRVGVDSDADGIRFADRSTWTAVEPVTNWEAVAKSLAELNESIRSPASSPLDEAALLAEFEDLNALFGTTPSHA